MHSAETRDILPGISAVLVVKSGQTDIEAVVLDLGAVLDGLVADNFEIIVVEFGTTQRTADLLADLTVRWPNLPLHILPDACADRQSALQIGFEASAYDLLFVTTVDGQFDMSQLNRLLASVENGADLAIGYRPRRADGPLRRLDGWLRTTALNLTFGQIARDAECEFKLFRRTVWERLRPQPRSLTFNVELLLRARRSGFVIHEVAVSHRRPRQPGPPASTSAPISLGHRAA
jgi:glycosyltransferase involved in cell wall biosynthesis